jgi:saccharopine dehydrogenase-like NADP-dependent oxidoreductase
MRVLLLGVGLQGKAALRDLALSPEVDEIIAADKDIKGLKSYVAEAGFGDKVLCKQLDAEDVSQAKDLMGQDVQVAIDLLPIQFTDQVAATAVREKIHLINTMAVSPEIAALAEEAKAKEITILPEFGLDPGIDLMLLGKAVQDFESLEEIRTYGAGIPEPDASDNPLRYKVTWTFDGVLFTYTRPGHMIQKGEVVKIPGDTLFHPENIHEVVLEDFGKLEAYPSGDALAYAKQGGIDVTGLRELGRYTLRWPGHCAFWRTMVEMHLLDDEPVMLNGTAVDRKRFLAACMEPHLQLGPQERDLAILRVEVVGVKNGEKMSAVYQLIDWRDLDTGFTAMSRTVGYTASIGAILVGKGEIAKRGILSPISDLPHEMIFQELAKRGIQVTEQFTPMA